MYTYSERNHVELFKNLFIFQYTDIYKIKTHTYVSVPKILNRKIFSARFQQEKIRLSENSFCR